MGATRNHVIIDRSNGEPHLDFLADQLVRQHRKQRPVPWETLFLSVVLYIVVPGLV